MEACLTKLETSEASSLVEAVASNLTPLEAAEVTVTSEVI